MLRQIIYDFADNLEVTGVSRCGRVRKKSSKLVDFQSPDDIDTVKTPKRTTQKSPSTRTPSITQRSSATHHKSTIKAYFQPIARPISHASTVGYPNSSRPAASIVVPDKPEALIDKEIRQLLSPSNHCDDFDNNNDDSDEEYEVDTTMRRSAYMSEKSTKKKIFKDGEIVLSRPQRKDKGKPRFTAYMLWSKEVRHEMLKSNPDMDFAQASRRLSSMWAIVPNNEKNIWRRRAKRVTIKNKRALKTGDKLTTKYLNKIGAKKPGRKPKEMKATSPSKKAKNDRKISATTGTDITSKSNALIHSSQAGSVLPGAYKVTGIGPSDVAAHLKLLGDNLAIIGQRLKEHEVSGSHPID